MKRLAIVLFIVMALAGIVTATASAGFADGAEMFVGAIFR